MESLYNLANTKNIQTIKSSYEFLLILIPKLKSAKNNSHYSTIIQSALGQYNAMHPGKVPQEYQLTALTNPDTFNLNEFYCSSLVNAAKRFYEKQFEEIIALKKETAKTKRFAKVVDRMKLFQIELHLRCSSSQSYPTAKAELEKLLSTLG